MNLEARKLSLVQEFLRIDNENIIGALEKFLHKSKSDFFEQNLKPKSCITLVFLGKSEGMHDFMFNSEVLNAFIMRPGMRT